MNHFATFGGNDRAVRGGRRNEPSARFRLKSATAPAHDRLDALYAGLDFGRREDYRTFLGAHACAFLPLESALDAAGAASLMPGWRNARRSAKLREDLADLAVSEPEAAPVPMAFASETELLGGLYVIEGSRLGGAMLARGVAPGLPARFLGAAHAAGWRALIAIVDHRLEDPASLAAAVRSANAVFALFECSARRLLNGRPA